MADLLEAEHDRAAEAPSGRDRFRVGWLTAAALMVAVGWVVVAYTVTPLETGSFALTMGCEPETDALDVDDTFGGGGTVLAYTEGARCSTIASVRNRTFVPVRLTAVQLDPTGTPLPIDNAERSRTLLHEDPSGCIGCDEAFVPFDPVTVPRGQELAIRTSGTMASCSPPPSGVEQRAISDTLRVEVRVLGLPRTVDVPRGQPYAISTGSCP